MCTVLRLLLLLLKLSYAIIADIYSLTHFRFSVCKALDPGPRVRPTLTEVVKVGAEGARGRGPLRRLGPPGRAGAALHRDESHYFAIAISWLIFGSGQSVALMS